MRVMSVDSERGKFAVTMIPEGARAQRGGGGEDEDATGERPTLKQQARAPKQARARRAAPPVKAGDVIKGKVAATAPFGVFVEVSACAGLWLCSECRAPTSPPAGGWVGLWLWLVLHTVAGRAAVPMHINAGGMFGSVLPGVLALAHLCSPLPHVRSLLSDCGGLHRPAARGGAGPGRGRRPAQGGR